MATLDHIGLNRFIYMSASVDDMTLGSHTVSDISNSSGASILGGNLDASRLLLGINLYNNGPYGYSSWQQSRMSDNPLSRHLRSNNRYSIVGNSFQKILFKDGKKETILERHGRKLLLDEPAVVSNYKPAVLVGTVDFYNKKGGYFSKLFAKKISLNNNITYFTNKRINNIVGITEREDEVYDTLKSYYLEDALNSTDSPLSSFESLFFEQTIYPPQQYTYKSYTRARTTFDFPWHSDIALRQQISQSSFDVTKNLSEWPLDVSPVWQNMPLPLSQHLGVKDYGPSGLFDFAPKRSSSFGELWNHHSQLSENLNLITNATNSLGLGFGLRNFLSPGALYSRRHTLIRNTSVVAPSGRTELIRDNSMTPSTMFGGEAYWDVPRQSGKYPFHDSYGEFSDEMRRLAKDFTIVPEFRMSQHVESFFATSAFDTPENLLEISGAKGDTFDSSKDNFYRIYSNTDFLKNFDVVLEDHKDFTDPVRITLKCKAIKKLVPYDGFYPVQRSLELAKQFYSSYSDDIVSRIFTTLASSGFFEWTTGPGEGNIMTPLFAPGVLFNSIKSGVAVDYPLVTSSLDVATELLVDPSTGISLGAHNQYILNNFNKRIPFEALVEPEKYLADTNIFTNEPHFSGNISASAYWGGQGDQLYVRMANNFLAEVPKFFLKDETFTTIASLPQSDPNFGQVTFDKTEYRMRVKMFRSMDRANHTVTSSAGLLSEPYVPPQDIIASERKETITMYSRPSAFGPPSKGDTDGILAVADSHFAASNAEYRGGSEFGLNYPFTPPYYHGQGWADIIFTPTEDKKYTVADIIASSSVEYYRFDTDSYHTAPPTQTPAHLGGPQQLAQVNNQAMQLSASVNLFSKGVLEQGEMGLNIQLDDQSKTRWIIQPKFETPILNFIDYISTSGGHSDVTLPNNASSASVPVGMWHQYGRLPTQNEGIYLQVTDVPRNWLFGREGKSSTAIRRIGSLAELCGFSQDPVKLGKVSEKKRISECVVAVPFIENRGVKEFFTLNKEHVNQAKKGEPLADETLVSLIDKMKRFIFPPSFDFFNYPLVVDPIAMYVFEFSSYLSQQDLVDIWQNVLPDIGREHEVAQSTISHSLLSNRKMINQKNLREDIRWMVFKVKQRAASRYFDGVFTKEGNKESVFSPTLGFRSKIQYNWPYDFFSLVELVKIDAGIVFSDVETDDNGEERTKPKVANEENRRVQLNTLFPKGKK